MGPMASTKSPPEEAISPAAWRALAIGAAGFVLVGFNGTATNLAFGDIIETFSRTPETTIAFVSSGYLIGTAAFMPLAGRIADRRGRRRIFMIGVAIFGISALLSALAPNVWILVAARVLQSVGGALVIPASLSMALPLFPASRRSGAVAAWAAAGPISAGMAPTISAAVLQISSWRWLYLLSAPISLVVLLLGSRHLQEVATAPAKDRLDYLGAVLGTMGIALFVFGVGKGQDWGWSSLIIVGCFVVSILSIAAFFTQSARHPQPLIDFSLFSSRQVWVANLANTLVSVTSLSIWLVWPLYLQRLWDYSSLQIGLALTAGPVAASLMTLLGGRIADRVGHRIPIQVGSVIMVAAVGWCWFMLSEDGTYVTSFLPGIAMFGTGWGLSSPTMNSFALDAVPEESWGSMNAAFNTLRNVAGAVGVAAVVAFIGDSDRLDIVAAFDRTFAFLFVFTALGAACVLLLYPNKKALASSSSRDSAN